MANHKSAIKRNRQNLKRREHNRAARSAVRTEIKRVRGLLESGDTAKARESLVTAERAIAKAATKGLYHRKNASRKISRLAAAVARSEKGGAVKTGGAKTSSSKSKKS